MPYFKEALLKNVNRIGSNDKATYANLVKGGQLGLGEHLRNIDAATPLVLPSVIPVVTHIPEMFKKVPNLPEMLKALIEGHAKTITGIDLTYSIETGAGYNYKDSQVAEVPIRATRAPVTATFTFPDYAGEIVRNFFKNWQEMIIDPETQFSKLSSYLPSGGGEKMDPFVYSYFTMDILYIQPDITLLPENIIGASLEINMFPKTIGPFPRKRDVNAAHTVPEVPVEFSGVIKDDANTYSLGVQTAKLLSLHKANYHYAENPTDSNTKQTIQTESGLQGEINEILNDFKLINSI